MADKIFELNLEDEEISKRVRAILGVPDNFLTDEVICSPIFKNKAVSYINKAISDYAERIKEIIEEFEKQNEEILEPEKKVKFDFGLLEIASMYYISYALCIGMDARLPKQMENLSTKTLLQNINWDEKALELLNRCDEAIEDFLEENGIDDTNIYNTFAELSAESQYPNTNL